jgi:ketosteroid isomerase-like protein
MTETSTKTVTELAEHVRERFGRDMSAGLAALAPYAAEQVEVAHEPAHPADGIKPRAQIAEAWSKEGEMLQSVIPDADITDLVVTTRGDDQLLVDGVFRGTLPDGSALAHEYKIAYEIRHGRVVRAVATYDPAPLASLADAFEEQFQPPE